MAVQRPISDEMQRPGLAPLQSLWRLVGASVSFGDQRRPAIFALLFWMLVGSAIVAWVLDSNGDWRRAGALPFVLTTAALVTTWGLIPWDAAASWRRKLAVPAFLAASLAFGSVTFFLWGLALYPITVANAVFAFGFGRGIAFAVAAMPLFWASVYLVAPDDLGVAGTTFLTAITAPMAVFMLGICKVVRDAERGREEVQVLLGDLAAANAELRRQAERTKALAIAEERARVAREVHDSLGHHLTAINLQLQNAERFAPRDPERSLDKVREARASTLAALAEVWRSVRALKPAALDELGGAGAIAALACSFDGAGPSVSFRVEGTERPLPAETELALYRVAQEGLTNAARHAGARRVDVRLAFNSETATLVVADDGDGVCSDSPGDGFGLAALRDRVESLGGTLAAGNRPGGGFMLEAVVPAPQRMERET
jgi:signal transduction histidine kinase